MSTTATLPERPPAPPDEAPAQEASEADGVMTPGASSTPANNSLVSDDELAAALAEIEATADAIPSLDDSAARPDAPAAGRKLTFKVGGAPAAKTSEPSATADDAPSPVVGLDGAALPAAPTVPLLRRVARALDALLDAIHRPLGWLPPQLVDMVGVAALVTLATSTVVLIGRPWLMPHRDAVTLLDKQVAALTAAREAAHAKHDGHAADDGHGGGHGGSAKAAGHGEHGKKDAKAHGKDHGSASKDKHAASGHGEKPKKSGASKSAGHDAHGKKDSKSDAKGHGGGHDSHGGKDAKSAHGSKSKPADKSKSSKSKKSGKPAKKDDGHGGGH